MLTTLWRTVQPRYKQVTLVSKTWRWGVECRLYIDFRSIFVINCDNIGLGGLKSIINYMEGWWGKAVGGCVRLLSTTLNMIQNVSRPPAWLVNHPHNQTYLSHILASPGLWLVSPLRMCHSLIFSCMLCYAFSWCACLWVGTQDEKKGNEGQTENIRIIEISGKIFCVATRHCHPAEVMTHRHMPALLYHTNTTWGDNIYKWVTKPSLPPPPK